MTVDRPEHIPVDAYRLLRRLAAGPVDLRTLKSPDDEAAMAFLFRHGLATNDLDGRMLGISDEGKAIGRLMHKAP